MNVKGNILLKWARVGKYTRHAIPLAQKNAWHGIGLLSAAKHRSSKKVVGIYLDYELFKRISLRANKKGIPVSRFIKNFLQENF